MYKNRPKLNFIAFRLIKLIIQNFLSSLLFLYIFFFHAINAAHCLNDDDPTTNQIEYGTTVISHGSKGTNTVYFERTIIHEKFDPFTLFHDIGLIKTKSPMRIGLFEYKVKLPIPSDYFPTGTPAVLAGRYSRIYI